jgi:hypothetical protein
LVEITLSPGDVAWAITEGTSRYNYNRARGFNPSSNAPTWVEGLAREVSGCLGEIAVARWTDKFPFTLFSDRKDGDVGPFEVRTTAYQTGRLLLTEKDNPDRKYLLVTLPTHYKAVIQGWMWGYEALTDKYYNTSLRNPCYMVPQEDLYEPRSLFE